MNTICRLIQRYYEFIYEALREPGWIPFAAMFAVGFVDAVVPVPGGMDALVATAVLAAHGNFLGMAAYPLLAAAGNALGNIILYGIGYEGGEVFLHKRLGENKFNQMRQKFERREVLTLMLAAMMPPPFPFKAVVFSAAVFEVNLPRFLLGIFLGRLLRFAALATLVGLFGPRVIDLLGAAVREHLPLTIVVLAAIAVLCVLLWRWRKRRKGA